MLLERKHHGHLKHKVHTVPALPKDQLEVSVSSSSPFAHHTPIQLRLRLWIVVKLVRVCVFVDLESDLSSYLSVN